MEYNSKYLKQNIPFVLLLILCFYSLMPYALMSITLILFIVSSIVFNFKSFKYKITQQNIKSLIIQSGFYIFMIISVLYSSDKKEGLNELQTGLPLLLLPFCFFFSTKTIEKSKLKTILLTFVTAKVFYIVYLYNYFVYRINLSSQFDISNLSYFKKLMFCINLPFKSVINNAINVATNPPNFFFHKAYLSMSLLFAICIVAYYFILRNKKVNLKLIVGILLILLFSLVLFHWFSVTNIGLYFVIGFIYLISFFKTFKQKILAICFIIILSVIAYNFSPINKAINNNQRITTNLEEVILFVKSPFSKRSINNRKGSRAAVNSCTIDLIQKAILFGHGVGTPKIMLNKCYETKNFELGMRYNLNSHNYYFHIILSIGSIGFILFAYMFYHNFKFTLTSKDLLYFSFLLIIAVNLITENIIFRAHGVLFFALFNALFYKANMDKFNLG